MRLEGKVALVTGGARGIGEATVKLFAREGARVAICDLLEQEGRALETLVKNSGGYATFIPLDVTKEDSWQNAVARAEAAFGKLNVVVNNAGISGRVALEEMPLESWEKVMAVNSTGVMLGIKHSVPALRRAGGGSIINISSIYGIVAYGLGHPAYYASKGAVRNLTKHAAIRYAKENIRVNSVHPGYVDSPMTEAMHKTEEGDRRRSVTPMGRLGKPEDIAFGCLFLASEESCWMTGSELVIDGGYTAQ